ncbi:MAG TPA: hypothetical protein VE967_19385 [Gemmatimonadaceae bacterium]|nr:hypothetical protein [Gemmatimonadaceae bacterium]
MACKVYLVSGSSGIYDDYRTWPVAVFDEGEMAEEYAKALQAASAAHVAHICEVTGCPSRPPNSSEGWWWLCTHERPKLLDPERGEYRGLAEYRVKEIRRNPAAD